MRYSYDNELEFASEEQEFELEEETNRSSSGYVKWIQSSLNRIMGLRLDVDGIIGSTSRSAIRSFQAKNGLTVDGIVGPTTEAALIRAGARQPLGSVTAPSSRTPPLAQRSTCSIKPIRQSRPTVIPRPCCLLNAGLSSPGDNVVDPASIGKHGTGTEVNGIIYTSKAGFIDLGHIREVCDNTKSVYDQLSISRSFIPQTVLTPNGDATILKCPPDLINLAQVIAYDEGLGHEIVSYTFMVPGGHNSSFSPEDLCSNHLGSIVAKNAILAGGPFNDSVTKQLNALLKTLLAQSRAETLNAFKLIEGRWIKTTTFRPGSTLRKRNFSSIPWKAGHASDSSTPSFLKIPIPNYSMYYNFIYYEGGRNITKANFSSEIAKIRVDARGKYGSNYDKP